MCHKEEGTEIEKRKEITETNQERKYIAETENIGEKKRKRKSMCRKEEGTAVVEKEKKIQETQQERKSTAEINNIGEREKREKTRHKKRKNSDGEKKRK